MTKMKGAERARGRGGERARQPSSARGVALVALGTVLFVQAALAQATRANQVNLQVIVVDSPVTAQQILDRLKNGADFGALAKEKSIDPSAGNGGMVGVVDSTTLRPETREALAGLKPGQITGNA